MNTLAWRRTWFQVHKLIGLSLAVLIIPLSLSGAALVWDEALDRSVNPSRYAVSGDALLAPDAYVEATRAKLGADARVAQLTMPEDRGPVVVAVAPTSAGGPRPGPPARTMVYLDPPTARVLAVADGRSGLVRTLHMLHGSLLIPGVGRTIVGWIGVAMMISCFTGLWLWWPTTSRWLRGLRWKRHRHTDTNLHYLTGFWVALPLFVLSLTGAWISFPAVFGALVGEGARPGADRGAMMRAKPLVRPALALGDAVARAGAIAKGDLRSVAWPTERNADWTVTFGHGRVVTVADDSGIAAAASTAERGGRGVAGLMRRIHDGDGMGAVWQTIIFAGGLVPTLLGVTGVIMWWRARAWRGAVKAKRVRVA